MSKETKIIVYSAVALVVVFYVVPLVIGVVGISALNSAENSSNSLSAGIPVTS